MFRLLVLICALGPAWGLIGYPQSKFRSLPVRGSDYGEPLFITPYLEKGDIPHAQLAARVNLTTTVESYSGFFTVDRKYNSNLFFWFFPAEKEAESAPVLLWLQGGPGASSLFGLFEEHGPFFVTRPGGLGHRDVYWSKSFNVIYMDNPVGTGFSFTDDDKGYATTEIDVAKNLYSAMTQFFTLFPNLSENDFFVTGESYGGKYVPALAYAIHHNNPTSKQKINLKGLAIGNGLSDPVNQMGYGDYLFQLGLLDRVSQDYFHKKEALIRDLTNGGDFVQAYKEFAYLILGGGYFQNVTRFSDHYNILNDNGASNYGDLSSFLSLDYVRKAIHVGNLTYHDGSEVGNHLEADVMHSVAPWLSTLLNHYSVLVYNGQLDIIVPYPLTENYMEQMDWCGGSIYRKSSRKPWMVGSELAGYYRAISSDRCHGSLTEVLVRNAGHMVPTDQPEWAFQLISRFVNGEPL